MNMKNIFLIKRWLAILCLLIVVDACTAQIKNEATKIEDVAAIVKKEIQPKLIKTQGSNIADNVHCALQDKAGIIWFGTTGEGIYSYDGKGFTQFTLANGLNSNTVWCMMEDNNGNIWVGTNEGLCCYKKTSEKSKTIKFETLPINVVSDIDFNNFKQYFSSSKNAVWSLLQDKNDIIWIGSSNGMYCFNGKSLTHFLKNNTVINKENLQLKMVDAIHQDTNGNIWFASGMPPGMEGVCFFDGKTINSFKPNTDGWVRYIVEDKNKKIWFGGRSHGNSYYDPTTQKTNEKTITNFTLKTGIGNCILADTKANIWFTGEEGNSNYESKDGIWCYDGTTFKNYSINDGMGKYFVHSMFEDKNGNIWIGTRNTGLYKFDGKNFISFME